jgi:hypothetical protein
MRINFSPSEYVINVPKKVGKRIESDLLLRALRIWNNTVTPIVIEEVSFELIAGKNSVMRIGYPKQALRYQFGRIAEVAPRVQGNVLKTFLGRERFFQSERVTSSSTLKGGQEVGILLQHFRVLYRKPIDGCEISINYTLAGERKRFEKRIPVVTYKNKNRYLFPLKGVWFVVNNYDSIHEHRQMHSQEFAMDLIQLTKNFKMAYSKRFANSDYPSYNEKVYAIAKGRVVECFDGFPENPPGLGSRLQRERWDRLKKRYGFMAGVAGNYVILKHRSNEFSFYAHLVPGSLKVKKNSKVKKGRPIARLGNSGNSDAPHLHFQLMDGPDFLTARGLPCFFTNLTDPANEAIDFIEENNSIVIAE